MIFSVGFVKVGEDGEVGLVVLRFILKFILRLYCHSVEEKIYPPPASSRGTS